MSKIPFPGGGFIETESDPMTPEQNIEHDRRWEKLDHDLTLVWQKRLTALGYPNSFEVAADVYKNSELQKKIGDQYSELEVDDKLSQACGRLEKQLRDLES